MENNKKLIHLMRTFGIQSGYRASHFEHFEKLVKQGHPQALKVKEILEKYKECHEER